MKTLITLVKMQLKEKLNTNRIPFSISQALRTLLGWLLYILKFISMIFVGSALLYVAGFLLFTDDLATLGMVPDEFISIVFSLMVLLSIISCTARLTQAMYFAKDNVVLLTLPAKPLQIYLSKLIIFSVFEFKKNFSFIIPIFVAHFITSGRPMEFYPWLIVCFALISLFTVAVSSLLSIPAMWFATIFKRNKILQTSSIAIAVAAVFIGLFFTINSIPDNYDFESFRAALSSEWLPGLLDSYAKNLSWLYEMTLMVIGEFGKEVVLPLGATAIRFSLLLALTVFFFALSLVLVRPFFYTMASKPFEYLKREVAPKKNLTLNSRISPIYNEFLKSAKDSAKLFSNIGVMISIPVLVLLLNSMFSSMETDNVGKSMIIAVDLLIILIISLNANSFAASVYSRDGRAAYLIKVQPKNPTTLLIAKLVPSAFFCTVSFIATFVIMIETTDLLLDDCIFLMLGAYFIYLTHLLFSAGLDIMNPHTEIYAAVGAYENDPNEIKATSAAFGFSFLIAGIALFFLLDNDSLIYLKLFIVSGCVLLYRANLFLSNIRLYYKER